MDKLQPIIDWACGLSLAAAALLFAWRIWFLSRALTAEGEVIRNQGCDPGHDGDGGRQVFTYVYASVVSFRDHLGRRVQFESRVQSNPARHFLGQSVRVLYDPTNTSHAVINSPVDLWGFPVILAFLGIYGLWDQIAAAFP